jgi:uncharacterized protein
VHTGPQYRAADRGANEQTREEMPHTSGPGPEMQFKAFLAEGRFMIQKSRSTGRHTFYPRVAIPGSGETDLEWVAASGRGTVHAITVNRGKDTSYNIALVELDEGPRMMSCIEGVETVAIGTRVTARIVERKDGPAVVFVPADTGSR